MAQPVLFNRNAERAILGECIRNNDFIPIMQSKLPESCYFGLDKHILLYDIISLIFDDDGAVTYSDIEQHIFDYSLSNKLSTESLKKITETPFKKTSSEKYIESISSNYKKRYLLERIEQAKTEILKPDDESVGVAQSILDESISDATMATSTGFKNINEVRLQRIGSVLPDIDIFPRDIVVKDGSLIIIAARPSMGKTAYMMQMEERIRTLGFNTKTFSLEMPDEEILERTLKSKYNDIEGSSLKEMNRKAALLGNMDFCDNEFGILKIIAMIKNSHRQKKVDFVFIDYLQLMEYSKFDSDDNKKFSFITRKLKLLAMATRTKIVLLSQLNRSLENRDDKRPRLADLRSSGAIEQDANIVLFLYKPEVYYKINPLTRKKYDGETELIVGKNRSGRKFTHDLKFSGKTMTFSDVGMVTNAELDKTLGGLG